jgi:allophanate hydrolase
MCRSARRPSSRTDRAGRGAAGQDQPDQFATGLNGTRSPYGACRNSVLPEYPSGGSSAGSSLAVALGVASFALGTDTAGSGRVPAA